MIDPEALLDDLQTLNAQLVDDLRRRTEDVPEIEARVRGQYRGAKDAGRTDRSYEEWREDFLAQVAVAWVLATVFVRFCEDNGLYPTPLLSGPGDRRELAGDHRITWLGDHPASGDRDWLLEVFERYRELPGMRELLGEHNPLWQFGPSDDGGKKVLEVWRARGEETGALKHDFTDAELDTRFLGDLYQDLSDHAKKAFALLQTPEFVEEFILDRTLDPAIETFGLAETKLIDPTCGSGHFLLGAFDRILERWRQREPGTPIRELAQRTLDAVNGVDLNPFAVAIARFRLLVTALKAAEIERLSDAPDFHFRVAAGDSLIHGTRSGQLFTGAEGFSALMEHRYPSEDGALANEILQAGTYQAVVGNPPYITVKERALRDAYRSIYPTAYGKYAVCVPFVERFFDLTVPGGRRSEAGFVGLITSNSFMTRSFGRKFVGDFVPTVDLTHVIDTSGAYIPGHGTPTLILFGRHRGPTLDHVRGCLGIRGEPGTPAQPARGEVWTSILNLVDEPGAENQFVSVEDLPRSFFATHPWSLQGGAAPEVKEHLDRVVEHDLDAQADSIGITSFTLEDNAFLMRPATATRLGLGRFIRPMVTGNIVRDWMIESGADLALFPYDSRLRPVGAQALPTAHRRHLWPDRQLLKNNKMFGGKTKEEVGLDWTEYGRLTAHKLRTPLSITFAFVATHNHFVLDRGGKVFNRSAPVIKLPDEATETDHLRLLGLLNSSTACFWMKQVFHNKGSTVDKRGARQTTIPFEDFYEHDGTKLKQFPLPDDAPLEFARELDQLARTPSSTLPSAIVEAAAPTAERLSEARSKADSIRARMVALQEELDWQCYRIYGLAERDLRAPRDSVPELQKGQRAFEFVLARKMAAGEVESTWFERHDSEPITELPSHWPPEYREVVEERIARIEADRAIRLLERPEHKRRWNWDTWDDLEQEALRGWILDRLEAESLWSDHTLRTTAQLADALRRDEAFVTAAELYTGRADHDLTELVTKLVADEAVPFHVGYRFKASGMRRRREWEKVWDMQRHEDEIDGRTQLDPDDPQYLTDDAAEALKKEEGLDDIPVPPKYRKSDYALDTAYRLRGKLDVPQERFIWYPDTHVGADSSLVIGWAGWTHLERAQALAAHYGSRRDEGAGEEERTALLAGLQELVPWLKQWHNELDPEYGQRMGDFFASFVETEARSVSATPADLAQWTPNS